jgi:hypothetical protein
LADVLAEIRAELGPATDRKPRGHDGVIVTSDSDDLRRLLSGRKPPPMTLGASRSLC